MMKRSAKALHLITLLQGLTVLVMLLGTAFAALLGMMGIGVSELDMNRTLLASTVTGFAVLLTVSTCCYVALISFLRMCQRLKSTRAFTEANSRALHRIGWCCLISAAALLAAIVVFELFWCVGPDCEPILNLPVIDLGVLALAFAGVGVICLVLRLLLQDAIALQTENDLTV